MSASMSVEEAFALTEWRMRHWDLIAHEVRDGKLCPRYACSRCYGQHFTLVTEGARLPSSCPRCGCEQRTP